MRCQNYIFKCLILLILPFSALPTMQAQQSKTAAQAQPEAVKTSAHLNIPGTRILMLKPEGYEFNYALGGFMKGSEFFVKAMEIEIPYSMVAKDFDKKKMEKDGQKVLSLKKLTVSGMPAIFMISESEGLAMHSLVFGTNDKSIMVMGATESKNAAQSKAVETAILSAVYDASILVDPKATAAFTMDEAGSSFKYATKTMASFLYSKDGNDPTFETGVPYVEISQYPAEEGLSLEEFVKSNAETSLYGELPEGEIKNGTSLTINGMKAYQLEVHGTGDQKGQIHYYCGMSNERTMIVFTGRAPADVPANLKEFKRLTSTIKLK